MAADADHGIMHHAPTWPVLLISILAPPCTGPSRSIDLRSAPRSGATFTTEVVRERTLERPVQLAGIVTSDPRASGWTLNARAAKEDAARIQRGAHLHAEAEIEASHLDAEGVVEDVEEIDRDAGSALIRGRVGAPSPAIERGAKLELTIDVPRRTARVIPRRAVLLLDEGAVVYVARGGGFEKRAIDIGEEWTRFDEVEVRSGLEGGETIAVDGAILLSAKSPN